MARPDVIVRFARADDGRLAALSPEHWRRKAAAKRFEKDRRLELVAGGLLMDMIRAACGARRVLRVDFANEPNGKPYAVGRPDVHFNVSHSEDVVMCVLADRPVGCDVEKEVPLDAETKKAVGSVAAWTFREAKFKCGKGAGEPFAVDAPDGYRAAVCLSD